MYTRSGWFSVFGKRLIDTKQFDSLQLQQKFKTAHDKWTYSLTPPESAENISFVLNILRQMLFKGIVDEAFVKSHVEMILISIFGPNSDISFQLHNLESDTLTIACPEQD